MKSMPKPTKADRPKKRKKKTPRQLIIRDLDAIVREIVFIRDEQSVPLVYKAALDAQGAYEYAVNHSGIDQPGHVISRAKMGVRWDLRNIHKQDASDNLLHEFYPEVYNQWYIKTFGLDSWNELVNDSRPISKYSMDDLETLYFELTEMLKILQGNPNWKPYYTQRQIMAGDWSAK